MVKYSDVAPCLYVSWSTSKMVKIVCAHPLLYCASLSLVSEKVEKGSIVCKLNNNKHLQNFILNLNN